MVISEPLIAIDEPFDARVQPQALQGATNLYVVGILGYVGSSEQGCVGRSLDDRGRSKSTAVRVDLKNALRLGAS